ncbi:MAG: DNA topoisomerase IV subunit B, partial [Lachnospiraceae bacterium]|nr:DNA topoisomerase IV subunit B [Candidatus Equihabitans merdae]
VVIKREGAIHHDHFAKGVPTIKLVDGHLPTLGKTKETGTTVNFLPDPEIFEVVRFSAQEVKSRLHETAYLNPGLTIDFSDKRKDPEENFTYHEMEGIVGFVKDMTKNDEAVTDPIFISGGDEGIEVEVAFRYINEFHENVMGFCNNIFNADGGTHLTGFKTAFTTVMNNYARELGILKDKDQNFTGADIRNGMTAIVSIKHPDPRFEGQTKTKLDNPDASKIVAKVTAEQIPLFFDRNLEVLKAVLGCAEKSAKIRKTEEKAKTNLLVKQKYSFDSNGKLANCESRDASKCELFIVEGDSAGGSAKTARDRSFQAILPIRGKILNVEKASIDKILANAEIKTMINSFGCGFSEGYGNDFDISKLRYDKIIIMADADVDGAHIGTLLLTLFYRFMPDLIREGHIYIAMPPLYKVMPSKGEGEYLYDDKALEKYRKTHKDGKFTLQRYKGLGEMDPDQLWETTLDPATRRLRRIEIADARLSSAMTEILMGTEVGPRRDFIYEHAVDAQLDI